MPRRGRRGADAGSGEREMLWVQQPVPSNEDVARFVAFMEIVNNHNIVFPDGTTIYRHHFETIVTWFHIRFLYHVEFALPVIRAFPGTVDLLELYLTVKRLGGYHQVTIEQKWVDVAYAMGYPVDYAEEIKGVYQSALCPLVTYYGLARPDN